MGEFQSCPVCGKEQIAAELNQCPQCNADLSCFIMLDTIMPEKKTKIENLIGPGRIVWGVTLIILLFIAGGLVYQQVRLEKYNEKVSTLLTDNQRQLNEKISLLITDNQKRSREYQLLLDQYYNNTKGIFENSTKNRVEKKEDSPEDILRDKSSYDHNQHEFFWYKTTDKDTLWDISEKFYQNGKYYPVLLAMNPSVYIFDIRDGQRLKILKDRDEVDNMFIRFTIINGDDKYFWYQVQKGDTPQSISEKFYKTEDKYQIILKENSTHQVRPGEKLKILLEEL